MSDLRRLRGLLGTAVLWACGGAALYIAFRLALAPFAEVRLHGIGRGALFCGKAGAIAGAIFAMFVIRFGRGQPLEALSTRRFAWWGAAAGVLLPAAIVALYLGGRGNPPGGWIGTVMLLATTAAAGRGIAVGSLRAARADRTLPADARSEGPQAVPPAA